jgi:uncharacterized protein
MIRFVLIAIITVLSVVVLNWFWQLVHGGQRRRSAGVPPRSGEPMVQDPVCGTYLPQSTARAEQIGGERRYFCSERCAERYRQEAAPGAGR